MNCKASAHVFFLALALPSLASAGFIQNGSFENPQSTWTNSGFHYMAVASGSSAITDWSVVGATGRGVAWAQNPTNDGFFASNGSFFVDLSGFGTEAGPNARLEQTLQNLIAGQTYEVSLDYWGDRATMTLGGNTLATAAAATSGWTRLSGSFQATASQALLSVGYIGGSGVAFVDNVVVTGPGSGPGTHIPEPGALALTLAALTALAVARRRC